ncbi:MAG: PRTRC system protein C [Burkholderiales bacterium]
MTIQVTSFERSFSYNGVSLPDPGAALTLEQVRDVYSAAFPEIVSASIEGPEQKNGKLLYVFRKAVGSKG